MEQKLLKAMEFDEIDVCVLIAIAAAVRSFLLINQSNMSASAYHYTNPSNITKSRVDH